MTRHCADGGMIVAATHLPLGLDGAKGLVMGELLPQQGTAS
jgi:heme exporter protein A